MNTITYAEALEICSKALSFRRDKEGVMFSVTPTGCWEWKSNIHSAGYGNLRRNGRVQYAHRFSYALVFGPVPEGVDLDHLCRNRPCINPFHLEPVTHRTNCYRGARARLSLAIAQQIRDEYAAGSITMRALAAKFGVYSATVNEIVHGRAWRP